MVNTLSILIAMNLHEKDTASFNRTMWPFLVAFSLFATDKMWP